MVQQAMSWAEGTKTRLTPFLVKMSEWVSRWTKLLKVTGSEVFGLIIMVGPVEKAFL